LQKGVAAHEGFSPAIADCGRQGTATSPPSTTSSSSIVYISPPLGPPGNPSSRGFWPSPPISSGFSGVCGSYQTRGGEGGIRTHGTLLRYTRSPGVPIQPALAPLRGVLSTLIILNFGRRGSEIGDGGRGIRTPEEPFGPLIDFESIAFVHSAIPPYRRRQQARRRAKELEAVRASGQPPPLSRQRGHCPSSPGNGS
jgi:hypothetical protein